ncbi:dehydrogenase/reductase SDR family member 4-like [Apostichopus japonicus]|uniref:dehydrogenase/reductase SDR family member 4-like n=1 Tax=Stichopus japonicus TaxID=307972 RepID=UPI003AB8A418
MSLQRFAGKVAVLTGSTQGIGLATAQRLGREGCKVVVSSRRENNVQEAVDLLRKEGIEASGVKCHQGAPEDRRNLIQHALDTFGGFDCVFMSAGVNPHIGPLLTVKEKEFQKVFDINVKANFMFIQECMPHLVKRGGGAIVTNATSAACDFGMAFVGQDIRLYTISKLALAAMTNQVARDCYNQNVRVNCVLPGIIKTQFAEGGVGQKSYLDHLAAYGINRNDLAAELGKPEEIGSVVAFLLSADAAYISGECVACAGGMGPISHVF